MKKFMAMYMAPAATIAEMMKATPEQMKTGMDDWMKWSDAHKKEIVERMIFPMINEGARLLEEGIARRPGDIDVVWVYGYAWPVWRGGPMFYADTVGLPYIRDQLAKFAAHSKDKNLEPAALLKKLAAEDRGFASLSEKAA